MGGGIVTVCSGNALCAWAEAHPTVADDVVKFLL